MATVLLNNKQIDKALEKLAQDILDDANGAAFALVGIRSRGEIIAQRLQHRLGKRLGNAVDCGTLDITLYRDDLNQPHAHQPTVRTTEIDFDINDRLIVLVDDVLNTGRSARAALGALLDIGRPQAVRLAVLIDRGHRELPIRADYVGETIDAPKKKHVSVYLNEQDQREEIVLE